MNLKLDWQKRAIILFAAIVLIFSVILTVFAIREAEREKLVKQREINQELERIAASINEQVVTSIRETEELSSRLLNSTKGNLNESELTNVASRIEENEDLVAEIFYVDRSERVIFPSFKPLYYLSIASEYSNRSSAKIEENQLFKSAEAAEYKARNYSLAISTYRQLMRSTSDRSSSALIMNRIARCYKLSGNFDRSIQTYKQIVSDYLNESSSDGIPYALIALYQMGGIYSNVDKELDSREAFLELYDGLLESRWSLSQTQFQFYLKKIKAELAGVRAEIDDEEAGKSLAERWTELQQLEKDKLKRMSKIEDIAQKIIPLIETRKTASGRSSGSFSHISQSKGKKIHMASYTFLERDSIFGFTIDHEYLKNEILPFILEKVSLRKGFFVQVTDDEENVVTGGEASLPDAPYPQLSYSQDFKENFPPWKVKIYQALPSEAESQFRLRRNIYVLSVGVVIVALLFGGVLAIRSTAKELKLAKLKSEFVSTVSHEFRTPLTSIRYLAELLQRGRVKEESKKQQYYESITHESERLSRLIENILDFSKIEAGMKEYEFEKMDFAELCRDVVSRFQEQVAPQEFTIESEISEELPKIFADREALSRALFNLLDNAVKYSRESRKATFRAWSDQGNIYIKVEDQGIGISQDDQGKVFEKFYRSGDIHNSSIKGSGIGLTIVFHIAKAHGGEVLLESDLGKGTKVIIQLPRDRKVQ